MRLKLAARKADDSIHLWISTLTLNCTFPPGLSQASLFGRPAYLSSVYPTFVNNLFILISNTDYIEKKNKKDNEISLCVLFFLTCTCWTCLVSVRWTGFNLHLGPCGRWGINQKCILKSNLSLLIHNLFHSCPIVLKYILLCSVPNVEKIMAWRLVGAKPLSQPILECH